MEITKIGNLSAEEKQALITAGKIIGEINKALEAKNIDILAEEAKELLAAVEKVTRQVLGE